MLVRSRRESNTRSPALQSSQALPTELILPIAIKGANRKKSLTMPILAEVQLAWIPDTMVKRMSMYFQGAQI